MASLLRLKRLFPAVVLLYGLALLLIITSLPRDFGAFVQYPFSSFSSQQESPSHPAPEVMWTRESATSSQRPENVSMAMNTTKPPTYCFMRLDRKDRTATQDYFKPSPDPVTEVVSKFLIQPSAQFCAGPLDVLFLVPSSPGKRSSRDAIRQTWGSGHWPLKEHNITMAVLFLLARPPSDTPDVAPYVQTEAAIHHDLLVVDAEDGYRQMTVKMLAGLQWLSQHCGQVMYVARVDEDHFLNVPLFFNKVHPWFQQSAFRHSAIVGKVLCSTTSIVTREISSKHFVDFSDYPYAYFPTYMGGGTFIMSADLVPRLVNLSRYMKSFTVDDAFITGVLVRILDVLLVNLALVVMEEPAEQFMALCGLSKHQADPEVMQTIWEMLHKQPQNCSQSLSFPLRTCAQWCAETKKDSVDSLSKKADGNLPKRVLWDIPHKVGRQLGVGNMDRDFRLKRRRSWGRFLT